MRVLIHSAPPWAPSGYGLQCRFLARALKNLGHAVAISAFGGCHENAKWHGFPILSCGPKTYGNGVIAGNYRRWNADLLITLGDLWVMPPEQFQGLTVMPVIPVDCEPLGVMDRTWLEALKGPALHPVAMSEFGARMLAAAGHDAPVLPHCTAFRPVPAGGAAWRRENKIPAGLFLIAKVGVNNEDDRKAFEVTLQAFAEFARGKDDVGLYCHTEPQVAKAPNLAYMALDLGIAGRHGAKITFPEEHRRAVDGYGDDWMHGLYCAADVVDAASKGEGFGVPSVEALACGTPVIAAANSAMTEKITPDTGWLIGGQRTWARHHHAWWQTPSVAELAAAYEDAYARARGMRQAAAAAGQQWTPLAMQARLADILSR